MRCSPLNAMFRYNSGGYSGYSTLTELNIDTNIISNVGVKLFVILLNGNGIATFSKQVEVYAGTADGGNDKISTKNIPYIYDRASCTLILNNMDGHIIFVVANSGGTLYGVKQNKNPDGNYANNVEQY